MRPLAEAIEAWRERLKQWRAFEELASRSDLDRALAEAGLGEGQLPLVSCRLSCARMRVPACCASG